MKFRTIITLISFMLALIGFGLFDYFGPRMIIEIDNVIVRNIKGKTQTLPKPSDYGLGSKEIRFTSNDGFLLSGYLITTDATKQKGTLILVHGIRAYKEHFLPICKRLSDNGFNSVIIDLRAHGKSEGKFCTFGSKEKKDISILIDSLNTVHGLHRNYGIWGQSLGGAIAIQTLEVEKRIRYGIIESTFSDFKTIVHDYAYRQTGVKIPFINNYLIWRAERIADFSSEEVVPSESAKNITQPILMVHGKLDKRIKIEYGLKNFNNLGSKDKEFVEIKDANHLNVWEKGGDDYFANVITFINRVSKK